MCAVSAVSDYYQQTWPGRFPDRPNPFQADPEAARLMREVIERLDKIDKRLGDIECKDASKRAFVDALEKVAPSWRPITPSAA